MKLSPQIFTLFGLTLLLTSSSRTVLAGGSSSSSSDDSCDQIAPLPIFMGSGVEASYGTFIDGTGTEKEATYANLVEEYSEISDSVFANSSVLEVPQDLGEFHLLFNPREAAGEADDMVIYVPENKYIMFALGRVRNWDLIVGTPPPVDQLPPREVLEELVDQDPQQNFANYYLGPSDVTNTLDQAYAGTYNRTDPCTVALYSSVHNLYASELSFYLERTAEATVDGCKIPEAITYLTKSRSYPARSTDVFQDPDSPATLKTTTGWFMLFPPLTPGLHYIESRTYNAQFHPPDTLYPAGFEREDVRSYTVCVGDPSGCQMGGSSSSKKGPKKGDGAKGGGGKRMLKKRTTSSIIKRNGPKGIRAAPAATKHPEHRELTVVKGLISTETGYDL